MTGTPVRVVVSLATVFLAAGLSACGGASDTPAANATPPDPAATSTTTVAPFVPAVTVPAALLADPGLPSHVPPGPLSQGTVEQLIQYFENNVAQAYSTGNATLLDHYLAGPMLTGNAGTINYLNSQHKHNVIRVTITGVSIDTNGTDRVVFDMTGELTVDYFVDTTNNQVLDGGLPGPSDLDFLSFVDYNPSNRTWYWTGEQDETSGSSGSSGSSGADSG